jgi:hypothetical protein
MSTWSGRVIRMLPTSERQISYSPRREATQEDELDTLVAVYRFILYESRASNEGGPGTALDDAMKGSKHDRAN